MTSQQVINNFPEDISEFNNYTFTDCDLAQLDLTSKEFIDCTFLNCDLSMANIEHSVFSRVKFIGCKLIGLDFSRCSRFVFSVSYSDCIMDFCFFHKNKMKKTVFKKCSMKEMSFLECELNESAFDDCDLDRTVFDKSNLTCCDFNSAYNYNIIPTDNNIKNAMFSYPALLGLLRHHNIKVQE